MKKYILSLLALAVLLTGCITKNPQNLTPIPPLPSLTQTPPMPPTVTRKLMAVKAPKVASPIFYDPFNSGTATPWTFYQGSHLFTSGVLRLNAVQNNGAYAYVRTNWTNISVSADVKLGAGSWGAAVGLRYNPTNGANYQLWIYGNGRLSIEKYGNWFTTWTEVVGMPITPPGTNVNNLKLAITNNILVAYLNNNVLLTYTDTSAPLTSGGIDLSVWGGLAACTADFDNVTVYDLSAPAPANPPAIVAGLTNDLGIQGQPKTLSVTATGTGLTYTWKAPDGTTAVGTNTYTITNLQQEGTYSVTVSNGGGTAASAAYLSVGTTNILDVCSPRPAKTSVTLAWCPSPGTNIAGYKVYYGATNPPVVGWQAAVYDTNQPPCPGVIISNAVNPFGRYTNTVNAGTNLTATVTNLASGATYYFSATAYDTTGLESDFSSEVSYTPMPLPPLPPTNVFLSILNLGNGQVRLQAKVCPSTLTTILYQNMLGLPWNVLATNVTADVYGNFSYIDSVTNSMRFYRALLQ